MFDDYDDEWMDEFGIISSHDCTGLIPVLPQSEYEWESYQALYSTELNGSVLINQGTAGNPYPEDDLPDPNP